MQLRESDLAVGSPESDVSPAQQEVINRLQKKSSRKRQERFL